MEEEIRETGLAEKSGNRMVSVDFSWCTGLAKHLACFRFVKTMTKSVPKKLVDQKVFRGVSELFFFEGQRLSRIWNFTNYYF